MTNDDNAGIAIILVGIIIVIAIVIIAALIVSKFSNNESTEQEIFEASQTFIDIYPRSEHEFGTLNYTIMNQGLLIQKGIIKKGIIERVNNLFNETNYTITLNNKYFYEKTEHCSPRNKNCFIYMDKIAHSTTEIIKIKETLFRIIFYIESGIIKEPNVCIGENSEKVENLRLTNDKFEEFYEIDLPKEYSLFYDKCYKLLTQNDIRIRILRDNRDKYDLNIKKYNKAHKTKYKNFENITISEQEYLNYLVEDLKQGFNEFVIDIDIFENREYKERDLIRIMLIDKENNKIEKSLYIS